ncbi:MAG: AtpZ/AtpI family protein [Acetobacteraceae bacterium]|nr:AtpZ/AtpI family protein [Acetobacteraceae bacterium]MSP30610.1 AtpZ/AtpI family protein [Acetobacteraceae bacterium]
MSDKQVSPDPAPETSLFEERLRAARQKQGLDPVPKDGAQAGRDASAMGLGLRVGVELVAALVVALLIGWALDRWLNTRPVFLAVFALLGGVAGMINVWRVVKPPP